MKFRKSGFTLIELMVVLAIISVLSTMALPSLAKMTRPQYSTVRNYGYAVPFGSYNFLTLYNPSSQAVTVEIELKATNMSIGIADTWEYGLCSFNQATGTCTSFTSPFSDGLECPSAQLCKNKSTHQTLNPGQSITLGFGTKHGTASSYNGYAPEACASKVSTVGLGLKIRLTDNSGMGGLSGTYAAYDDVGNSTFTIPLNPSSKL